MKSAVLIPGRPDKDEYYDPKQPTNSNNHWFPWLTKQLMMKDIFTVSVEVPEPYSPRYEKWKKEVERFDLGSETTLVGHSCGGGFLVRYLSEHKDLKVDKVILVAPWINPDNNPASDTADFFEFEIDPEVASRTSELILITSDNDHASVLESVQTIKAKIKNLKYIELAGKKHFCLEDLGTVEFPELLQEILK